MTIFELSYYIFGLIDLYIALIVPLFRIPSRKNMIILNLLYWLTIPACIFFFPGLSPYLALALCFIYIFILTGRNILAVCLSLFSYLLSIVLNYGLLALLHLTHGISEAEAATTYYVPYYIFLTIFLVAAQNFCQNFSKLLTKLFGKYFRYL